MIFILNVGIICVLFGGLIPEKTFCAINPEIQWNLLDVGTDEAWNYTQGRSDVVVAIIDSGVDFSHSDLENQNWINPNEIPGNGKDDDQNDYGDLKYIQCQRFKESCEKT